MASKVEPSAGTMSHLGCPVVDPEPTTKMV
jgi:hypothetical protein